MGLCFGFVSRAEAHFAIAVGKEFQDAINYLAFFQSYLEQQKCDRGSNEKICITDQYAKYHIDANFYGRRRSRAGQLRWSGGTSTARPPSRRPRQSGGSTLRYGEHDRCLRALDTIARSMIAVAHSGRQSSPAEGHVHEPVSTPFAAASQSAC